MSVGLLCRCDYGGLSNLTAEVHRHIKPDRTLILDVPDAHRGPCYPGNYSGSGPVYQTEFRGALPDLIIEWAVAEGIDALWTAETFYDDRLITRAHQQGIRTICYAMPELAPWFVERRPPPLPRQLHVPTWYRMDTLRNAQLLPFPIARDRLPYKHRPEVRHLFHPAASAMLDRNGTEILLAALPHIDADVKLTIRDPHQQVRLPPGVRIDVRIVAEPTIEYWEQYPHDIDLLVLPRRYAGLSLPIQECASLGVPALLIDSDVYAAEPFVNTIPSTGSRPAQMKGGTVPVHTADPRALANAINHLARNPGSQATASMEADWWAETHAWHGPLGDRWFRALG